MADQIVLYNNAGDLVAQTSVNLAGLSINGTSGSANQYLGKNGSNVLGFFNQPTATYPIASYRPQAAQNINALASNVILYQAPTVNNISADIVMTLSSVFTVNTAGTYLMMLISNCVASASDVQINLLKNASSVSSVRLGTTEFSSVLYCILSLAATDVITTNSVRQGVSATAKTLTDTSSALMFFRLS